MSLKQKYTWQDFLKDHPEHREKGTKRTSSEGKKAFEAAYKAFVKRYLAERMEKVEKLLARTTAKRAELVSKSKEFRTAGRKTQMKNADRKIGNVDAAIGRHQRAKEKNKALQKSFK